MFSRGTNRFLASVAILVLLSCAVLSANAEDSTEGKAEGKASAGLRSEEDVEKIREDVLSKLDKPLEKMKVKELKQLLTERGVTCTACSEKAQLVKTVYDSLHLPVKKETLQKMKVPTNTVDQDELNNMIEQLKKKQEEENKLKDMLRAQGMNVDGMNFGSNSMDPEMLAKILKNNPGAGGKGSKKEGKAEQDL